MRQINPMAKAWSNAAKSQRKVDVARAYRRKYNRDAEEYLESKHLFSRAFSDQYTGERRIMTGREAKKINDDLFYDYLMAMEKNVPGRSMERWKVSKKFIEEGVK